MVVRATPWINVWVLIVVTTVWAVSASADTSNAPEAETAIAQRLDAFHQAAADADFEGYFSQFSNNGVFIGTDASERWSVEAFKQYVKPYFSQGKGWRYVPRDRTIVIRDDVAWFDELLDNEAYGECRGSGVLIKEGGQWKIAQYNLHFTVPNSLAKTITGMIKEQQKKGQ